MSIARIWSIRRPGGNVDTGRRQMGPLWAVILLSAALLAPLAAAQGAAEAGTEPVMAVETIRTGSSSDCDIAVDPNGNPHVCYFDVDSGSLMYATGHRGTWSIEAIAGPGLTGSAFSLAVDAEGNAHVSYVGTYGTSYDDLIYATNKGGRWHHQLIDDAEVLGYTSAAVDGQGSVHISYHTGGSYEDDNLMYATNAGGTWRTEVVDAGQAGYYNAIAIGPNGTVHIAAYAGIGSKPLRHSTNEGGLWSSEDIEGSVWVGSFCSIALDPHGHPRVAASTSDHIGQVDLKHVIRSDGAWSPEIIEHGGYVWGRSIAIDGNDSSHICYRSYADNALMYQTNAGGQWSARTVDLLGSANSCGSIAVSSDGVVHMCYITKDAGGTRLKHATIGDVQNIEAPSAPTGLAASVVNGSVQLSWTSQSSGSAFNVYRGTDPSAMSLIATVNGTSYLDREPGGAGSFFYRVEAVDGGGASEAVQAVVNITASDSLVRDEPLLPVSLAGIIGAGAVVAMLALGAIILMKRK
jgi:hypothetical protein